MAASKQRPAPASRSGGRKAESPIPAAGAKVRLNMKAKKTSRNTDLNNGAHMFPFEALPSASSQKSTVSAIRDSEARCDSRQKMRQKNRDGSDSSCMRVSSVGKPDLEEVYRDDLASLPSAAQRSGVVETQSHGTTPYPNASNPGDGSISSSGTLGASSPQPKESATLATEIHQDVYTILSALRSSPVTHIELPSLRGKADSNEETPYTAQFLAQLYLLCYKEGLWNLCDLVADTWIRCLQCASRDESEQHLIWRENPALLRKQAAGKKGFDENAPDYQLDVEDPTIDPEVARFDENILNELYENTTKDCGARLLWADAMVLCGSRLEDMTQQMAKHGYQWHPELMFNIMCTSLRMVRRKLTLKIEESTEGAWCKRYHQHGRHEQPCYRWLAWQEQLAQDKEDGEDTVGAGKRKRGRGNRSGDRNSSKRVRFDNRDAGDIDAEGESEEE